MTHLLHFLLDKFPQMLLILVSSQFSSSLVLFEVFMQQSRSSSSLIIVQLYQSSDIVQITLQKMFQPHSVRGLLSRRNQTRLDSQEQMDVSPAGGDADLDSLVEAKLIIKDVEHKIEDIRKWRDNQKILFEQKLATNQAVAQVSVEEYLKHLDRQSQQDQQECQKIIGKLKKYDEMQESEDQRWKTSDTNLFECLANSNRLVEQTKYQVQKQPEEVLNHQVFISHLESLSQGILKHEGVRSKGPLEETGENRRALIKKQLQQIDQELKEIQDLLKD